SRLRALARLAEDELGGQLVTRHPQPVRGRAARSGAAAPAWTASAPTTASAPDSPSAPSGATHQRPDRPRSARPPRIPRSCPWRRRVRGQMRQQLGDPGTALTTVDLRRLAAPSAERHLEVFEVLHDDEAVIVRIPWGCTTSRVPVSHWAWRRSPC